MRHERVASVALSNSIFERLETLCYSRSMIRKVALLGWVPVASVMLMIATMYCAWAAAYAQLGRRPRPSIDDPNAIGGFSTDVYVFCEWVVMILFAIWALSSIFAVVMDVRSRGQSRSWGLGVGASLIALGLLVPLWFSSPGDAVQWFAD
jgi:hypothetical protein